VIVNKIDRVNRFPFDAAVERAFCRLEDFRAIATRYDNSAETSSPASASPPYSASGPNESGP
jgi:hypothetical protein